MTRLPGDAEVGKATDEGRAAASGRGRRVHGLRWLFISRIRRYVCKYAYMQARTPTSNLPVRRHACRAASASSCRLRTEGGANGTPLSLVRCPIHKYVCKHASTHARCKYTRKALTCKSANAIDQSLEPLAICQYWGARNAFYSNLGRSRKRAHINSSMHASFLMPWVFGAPTWVICAWLLKRAFRLRFRGRLLGHPIYSLTRSRLLSSCRL